ASNHYVGYRSSKPRGFREMDKKLNRVCNASRRNKDRHPAPTVRVKACPHYQFNVRYRPIADRAMQQKAWLFDHLIGATLLRLRHGNAERLGVLDRRKAVFSRSCGEA